MRLYYTVASQPEAPQTKASLSLGGFKSSSPVQSGIKGGLFGDISMYTVRNNNNNHYIALILKNELATPVTNVKIYFVLPADSYSTYKVGALDLTEDSDGNLAMEHVTTVLAKPIYPMFHPADGVGNAVDIGNLAVGEEVGIWVERTLNLDLIKTDQNKIFKPSDSDPYRYEEVTLNKIDEIEMKIVWD